MPRTTHARNLVGDLQWWLLCRLWLREQRRQRRALLAALDRVYADSDRSRG